MPEETTIDRYTRRRKPPKTPGFLLFSRPETSTEASEAPTNNTQEAESMIEEPVMAPETPLSPKDDPTAPDPLEAAKIKAKRARQEAATHEKAALRADKSRREQERKDIPILPSPPTAKMGGTLWADVNSKNGPENLAKAWNYWHDVNEKYPNRLCIHVYRLYPKQIKPDDELKGEKIYGFPDYEFNPDFGNFCSYIYSRWGSGNYKFIFKDGGLSIKIFELLINGLWDWAYPPIIPVDQIDLKADGNKVYIEGLRQRNIRLPGDTENYYRSQEDSMPDPNAAANASATATLVSTVEKLALNQRTNQDPTSGIEATNKAWTGVVETITDTFKAAQATQTTAADPTVHVKQVIELAKQLTPPPIDISAIIGHNAAREKQQSDAIAAADARADKLMDKMTDMMLRSAQERSERAEHEIAELRRKLETPSSPLQSPMSMLKEIIELKKEFDGLGGGAAEAEDAPTKGQPWFAPYLPMALPVLDKLVNVGLQLLRTPSPPPQPVYQQPPSTQGQIPQQQQPVQPQQPQGAQEQMNEMTVFFMTIAAPLMQHLNDSSKDGIDFAIHFIQGHGENAYDQLVTLVIPPSTTPKDTIIQMMKQYANGPLTGNLWGKISMQHRDVPGDTMPTPIFERFLNEFLDQEEVKRSMPKKAGEEEEEEEVLETLTPEVVNPVEPISTPLGPKRPRTLQ